MPSLTSDGTLAAAGGTISTEQVRGWPPHRTGILVAGHGSRKEGANREFERLVAQLRARRAGFDVRHAYIELASPLLADGIADIASSNARVLVIPCFLFAAGHVKNDIMGALAAARQKFPHVRFDAARVLGVHPMMAELAFERAFGESGLEDAESTAVVIVGRGTSDPDANGNFYKLARLFGEGRGFKWVAPCFIGVTEPAFEETIKLVACARPARIVVVPYMLFGGLLVARLGEWVREFSDRHPQIATRLAPHLGVHPKLLELIDARVSQALEGPAPLPCETCQYRVP